MASNPDFLTPPTSYADLIDSQFIKAADLQGRPMVLTIAAVHRERVTVDIKGKEEIKEERGSISFEKAGKRWMLNRTNVLCLVEMFGPRTADWVGKRVTLYAVPFTSPLFPDVKEAIRVHGSPDIPANIEFRLRLPFKKAVTVVLEKTTRKPKEGAPAPAPESPRTPGSDDDAGEASP